jgi:hypothetical protein
MISPADIIVDLGPIISFFVRFTRQAYRRNDHARRRGAHALQAFGNAIG